MEFGSELTLTAPQRTLGRGDESLGQTPLQLFWTPRSADSLCFPHTNDRSWCYISLIQRALTKSARPWPAPPLPPKPSRSAVGKQSASVVDSRHVYAMIPDPNNKWHHPFTSSVGDLVHPLHHPPPTHTHFHNTAAELTDFTASLTRYRLASFGVRSERPTDHTVSHFSPPSSLFSSPAAARA